MNDDDLRAENERLRAELSRANAIIRRAKDIEPVQRPSWKRVIALVQEACMSLERCMSRNKSGRLVKTGWLLKMGKLTRRFRCLKQIWEIFIAEEWFLSDIFPPQKEPYAVAPRLPYRAPVLLPYKAHVFNQLATNLATNTE